MTGDDPREAIEQAIARGLTGTEICIRLGVHPKAVHQVWDRMDELASQPDDRRPPRAQCGSRSGYNAHRYRREQPCVPCLDANNLYRRQLRARRKDTAA